MAGYCIDVATQAELPRLVALAAHCGNYEKVPSSGWVIPLNWHQIKAATLCKDAKNSAGDSMSSVLKFEVVCLLVRIQPVEFNALGYQKTNEWE